MEAKTVKSNMTDMTQGSPAGLILFFALPLLVGNMFQQLYNMVDSIVVGRFVGSTRRWPPWVRRSCVVFSCCPVCLWGWASEPWSW